MHRIFYSQPNNQEYEKEFTKGSSMESGHAISNTSFPCDDSFAPPITYKHNISFLLPHLQIILFIPENSPSIKKSVHMSHLLTTTSIHKQIWTSATIKYKFITIINRIF